jgi:hypothetical protein
MACKEPGIELMQSSYREDYDAVILRTIEESALAMRRHCVPQIAAAMCSFAASPGSAGTSSGV